MIETIKLIEQWGYDKNIHLASPLMQTTKTLEEAIELMQGVFRYEESIYSRYYDIQCVNVMPYSEFKKNKEKHQRRTGRKGRRKLSRPYNTDL